MSENYPGSCWQFPFATVADILHSICNFDVQEFTRQLSAIFYLPPWPSYIPGNFHDGNFHEREFLRKLSSQEFCSFVGNIKVHTPASSAYDQTWDLNGRLICVVVLILVSLCRQYLIPFVIICIEQNLIRKKNYCYIPSNF